MDIEEIIQTIIDNGNIEDMHTLSDILEDTMKLIQKYDEKCYKQFEMELYKMAFGNTVSRELAKEIVSNMRPYGEKWSFEETRQIENEYGIDIPNPEFYLVLNSAYNDFRDIFGEDIEMYIKYAIDFINDEDAVEGKVLIYYTVIPKWKGEY